MHRPTYENRSQSKNCHDDDDIFMCVVVGVIAAKSNDAVLHKGERGPSWTTYCYLCELSAYEPLTEAI